MAKTAFVPKYKTLYLHIKEDILSGAYRTGEKLPCERDLCAKYGVERVTLRHALELLDDEKLIEKKAGLGSFVKRVEPSSPRANKIILFSMRRHVNDILHNVHAFNAMLFFALEQLYHKRGYTLVYAGVENDEIAVLNYERQTLAGAMLISHHSEAATQATLQTGVPTICVNHFAPNTISILPDYEKGIGEGVRYLNANGHRRIGFITGDLLMINARERLNGYKHALFDLGIPVDEALIREGAWTFDSGVRATKELLALDNPPTAILTSSDEMALGAMEAIHKAGLSIPQDISVLGFDNIDVGRYCAPSLTTIGVSVEQIAGLSLDSLEVAARSAEDARGIGGYIIRTPTAIIERGSVAPRKQMSSKR